MSVGKICFLDTVSWAAGISASLCRLHLSKHWNLHTWAQKAREAWRGSLLQSCCDAGTKVFAQLPLHALFPQGVWFPWHAEMLFCKTGWWFHWAVNRTRKELLEGDQGDSEITRFVNCCCECFKLKPVFFGKPFSKVIIGFIKKKEKKTGLCDMKRNSSVVRTKQETFAGKSH